MRLCALCLLATAALGQALPEQAHSPDQLFYIFFKWMKRARTDEDALVKAAHLFDLSDLPAADRDAIGEMAAKDLLTYLNSLNRLVPVGSLPKEGYASSFFIHKTRFGNVLLERDREGTWRFSRATRKQASAFLSKALAAGLTAKLGQGAFSDASTWIRDRVPEWLHNKSFLLEHWQWLGLLLLVLAGVVAGVIGSWCVLLLGHRVARRRGVEIERGRRKGRPFGLVASALLWMAGLRFLALPEQVYGALMLAARFLLMVGCVWSLLRIIDWVAQFLQEMAGRTENRLDDLLVPMLRKALKVFVVALGVVWIADNLDMDIAALLAGLGIGGVALALASKDTVENFFGAVAILTDRPFQVGDWIKLGGIEGTVEEVGFRTTRVRTFYNSLITFPNAILIRNSVDNLGSRVYRRVKLTIGVTYDTPAAKLESFIEGIRELIRRHPYTRKDYYHVYFHGFGASSLDILLYLFLRTPDWATELRERHRLLMDIKRLAESLGVAFAFPTRTLHMLPAGEEKPREPDPPLHEAWKTGRSCADTIVQRFTGPGTPPPVVIGKRPDDAEASGEEG